MDMQEIRAKYPMYKDLSDDQLLSGLHEKFYSDMPYGEFRAKIIPPTKIGKDGFGDSLREVLNGTDWGTRNIASAGTALSNVWEGLKQFAGKDDKQRVEANKIMRDEAPVGAIAGDVALSSIPFAAAGNSLKAAGAVGAGYGALQPVEGYSVADIAKGKAISAGVGGVASVLGQAVANKAGGLVSRAQEAKDLLKSRNSLRDSTLAESIDAGYVVPPSMMPDSGTASRVLEGISGKYKTNQLAGIRNQQTTNKLAKEALGIADDKPLSMQTLDEVRREAYKPYQEIASLPKQSSQAANTLTNQQGIKSVDPAKLLDELKTARADSKQWFEAYNRSAHPDDLAKAKAFESTANKIDSELESYAFALGRGDLIPKLSEARKLIAKTYTVERAMKKGSGDVDAKVLGRLFEKNKPLSDGLDKIGKFGATFGDVAGIPKSGNANPFTIIDAGYSLGGGALNPLAYGLPLARVAARYGLLSSPAQKAISAPAYEVSPALRMGAGLLSNAPAGGTVLGLHALGQ